MGRRLEIILIIFVIFLAILPQFFKISNFEKKDRVITAQKSREIKDFTEYDINKTGIEFVLSSPQAQEYNDLWYLTNPKIKTPDITSLTSKYSIAKGNNIEFIENVKMVKKDGKKYYSQRAIYNTITKVIKTPERFKISKEYDMVNGINMEYFSTKKETKAKDVKAVFILKNR